MKVRLAAAALLALGASAQAQTLPAGKPVTIVIGNTIGGGYDLYGRLAARHFGRFLPGNPTVIPENMPGAGTIKAANFIYSVAPKDGTALGIVTGSLALEQASRNSAVQFDARRFTWIGRFATVNTVHMMWHTSKVQSIEDAKTLGVPVGGSGAGNLSETIPKLLNRVVGTKFNLISGYPASAEAMLAMERGEIEGTATGWLVLKSGKQEWLRDKKIRLIVQDVPERSAELPDVPALPELATAPSDKQLLSLFASGGAVGYSLMAPPGLSPATAAMLRDAFQKMQQDPEYIADARKMTMEVEHESGPAIATRIEKTLDLPEDVLTRARAIFDR